MPTRFRPPLVVVALASMAGARGGDDASVTTEASGVTNTPTTQEAHSLAGRWVGIHDCRAIVDALREAGAASGCGDDEDDVQRRVWPARRHDDFQRVH